jgi:glyoxylase-like metal-dependent hydrolase (beta-lactamase superfamily II)
MIHTIDLQFLGQTESTASFLVLGPEGPVLIETGPGSTLKTLLPALNNFGVSPSDIKDVLISHIHLDHGGAAGWWAQQGARVHVHYIGAPHLIDPSKLLASAQRIYGDMMQTLWGDYLASPAEKVNALHDGDVIHAGGLSFTAIESQGHAMHHMAYQLGDVAFVGDVGGMRISGRNHIRMPTPPPEFDYELWQASALKLKAKQFTRVYFTHFDKLEGSAVVSAHWDSVHRLAREYADFIYGQVESGVERESIVKNFTAWEQSRMKDDNLSPSDMAVYNGVGPLDMSADGIIRYWKRKTRAS